MNDICSRTSTDSEKGDNNANVAKKPKMSFSAGKGKKIIQSKPGAISLFNFEDSKQEFTEMIAIKKAVMMENRKNEHQEKHRIQELNLASLKAKDKIEIQALKAQNKINVRKSLLQARFDLFKQGANMEEVDLMLPLSLEKYDENDGNRSDSEQSENETSFTS
jgi:hypothetical protein